MLSLVTLPSSSSAPLPCQLARYLFHAYCSACLLSNFQAYCQCTQMRNIAVATYRSLVHRNHTLQYKIGARMKFLEPDVARDLSADVFDGSIGVLLPACHCRGWMHSMCVSTAAYMGSCKYEDRASEFPPFSLLLQKRLCRHKV